MAMETRGNLSCSGMLTGGSFLEGFAQGALDGAIMGGALGGVGGIAGKFITCGSKLGNAPFTAYGSCPAVSSCYACYLSSV